MILLVEPPSDPVFTLDEAKAHLRVDDDDNNLVIEGLRDAVVGMLDPAAGGWLGRALRPQVWELQLRSFHDDDRFFMCNDRRHTARSDFGRDAIALPYPPLIEVISLNYADAQGVDRTMVEGTDYRVLGVGGSTSAAVAPLYGASWPSARFDAASVRIRFKAGYPAPSPAAGEVAAVKETMPGPIRAWLKLQLGALYENRDSFVVGQRAQIAELPAHVQNMLTNHRVFC